MARSASPAHGPGPQAEGKEVDDALNRRVDGFQQLPEFVQVRAHEPVDGQGDQVEPVLPGPAQGGHGRVGVEGVVVAVEQKDQEGQPCPGRPCFGVLGPGAEGPAQARIEDGQFLQGCGAAGVWAGP